MKRYVEEALRKWKNEGERKPLIIRGARQVGKTWAVDQLGKEFDTYVKVDFEQQQTLTTLFDGDLFPKTIIETLELMTGKRILAGKTLLFFDEIQECPRALMALRYFFEELPDLHVIAAGSLLEFALDTISIPVGRVDYLDMYPMTFYEFLIAVGRENVVESMMQQRRALPDAVHDSLLSDLKNFFFVGGMPECVTRYLASQSLLEVRSVQNNLIKAFREDFRKYTPHVNPECLSTVWNNVARQVGEQIKYTQLDPDHAGTTNRKAFELLKRARLIHKIPAANPGGLPLGASASPKRFKACIMDIGLMQRLCQIPLDTEVMHDDLLAIYRGMLAEQFIAQELLCNGDGELHYWCREARGSSAEVDFLAIDHGQIHPIEVKSGRGGSLKSLHMLLKAYPDCADGYVLYSGNYATRSEQRLTFMPLYYAGLIGARSTCR